MSCDLTGDYQFDVYRLMREHTSGNWEAFHPFTNVMVSTYPHPFAVCPVYRFMIS